MTMADSAIDPKTGFNTRTKTFNSLRPQVPLPDPSKPLSITQYVFSLLRLTAISPPETTSFLVDAGSGHRLTYSEFLSQTHSLSLSLQKLLCISSSSKPLTAFIISPPSLHIPVLYFSLLSLGIAISPVNPLSSVSEINHQLLLSQPVIAFATTITAHKLPKFQHATVLLDSPEFVSMLTPYPYSESELERGAGVTVNQSDLAAILFSSGTTGRVKGVMLSHRNFIALIAGFYHTQPEIEPGEVKPHSVSLFTLPLFHVFGFFMLLIAASNRQTVVLMEKFDFEGMLKAVERYKVTSIPVSPPLIVALAKSDLVANYDLSSLQVLRCGGAPLGKEVADRFTARFPTVEVAQGYGLTETGGSVTRTLGPEENKHHGSVGRLSENLEAQIVDPETGDKLAPGQRGELWLRGPTIMKGYVGDGKATTETLDPDGWLKTGDLCYFDTEGFLYIVDRLKELIKYKAYQVPPAELEHLLLSNPEIADAAVIPYPDEEAGQIPMAFVVRKLGGSITEAQVMDFIAKQVVPYKKIRRVAFVNSIPKSPAGKILRRELVKHAVFGKSKL